jgi:hypothetical protein
LLLLNVGMTNDSFLMKSIGILLLPALFQIVCILLSQIQRTVKLQYRVNIS